MGNLVVIELAVLAQFYKNFAKTEPTLTTFHLMEIILCKRAQFSHFIEIYMFLLHAETNAFFHRVTSFNWKSVILGKQTVIKYFNCLFNALDSFFCLENHRLSRGNESYDYHMISDDLVI